MSESLRKQLIKLTGDLIGYPSVSGDLEAKKEVVSYVKNYFQGKKYRVQEYYSRGLPSVVITFSKNNGNPSLLLNGHLDVVPASSAEFRPKTDKNIIYGRGSGDMKAACAVMMKTMEQLAKEERPPSVGLMLTTDEEVGGFDGTGYLVKEKGYRPDLAVIPDGGENLSTLVLNEKGVLHLKIKAFGRSAHGSRPFLGDNAVDKLIGVYKELRGIIPQLNEDKWQNTMNLGRIRGGEATNQVPNYAEMYLDIRFVDTQDKKDILKKIKKITSDLEILAEAPPFIQDKENSYVKKYKRIAEGVHGEKTVFHRSEGASDARFFSEAKVPVISTKINCGNIHAQGEWVDINSMENFYSILVSFVDTYSQSQE